MSIQCAVSRDGLETKRDAFAAMSMDYLYASDQISLLVWPSLGEGDAGVWSTSRSERPLGTAPYRMAYSCSTPNVSRYYVGTAVSEFIADLPSGLLIEASVELVATATVYGCGMMGDLFIAFARISRAQFVEAFEVVRMEDVSGGADDSLVEIEVDFVGRKQVATTDG